MTLDTLWERLALRKVQLYISLACLKRSPAQSNQSVQMPLSLRINSNLEKPRSHNLLHSAGVINMQLHTLLGF